MNEFLKTEIVYKLRSKSINLKIFNIKCVKSKDEGKNLTTKLNYRDNMLFPDPKDIIGNVVIPQIIFVIPKNGF